MNYNMLSGAAELEEQRQEIEPMSVYQACEQITDGRKKRGVRYSVEQIVTLLILGKLAGMTTPAAIAEWVRWRAGWLKQALPWTREDFPCASTSMNVLRTLDAEEVNRVLSQLLLRARAEQRCEGEPSRLAGQKAAQAHEHLALDGKTLHGTLGHQAETEKPMHQLSLYETHTGIVLKEQLVGDKQNELSIVQDFLTPTLIKGRMITADALHTQRAFCWLVTRWEGDYLLIAKGNQPTLACDLELFFSEPPADCRDWRTARTVNKGHGRRETREMVVSTELNDFLAREWIGVAQVFRITHTVSENEQTRMEVFYGITSLSPSRAPAARLLELHRDHWKIEDRLHYRRDVTLREDACQVRKGEAPHVLSVLNSFLLGLCDFCGVTNLPQQMRLFDAQPWLAVRLLLGSLLTFT